MDNSNILCLTYWLSIVAFNGYMFKIRNKKLIYFRKRIIYERIWYNANEIFRIKSFSLKVLEFKKLLTDNH